MFLLLLFFTSSSLHLFIFFLRSGSTWSLYRELFRRISNPFIVRSSMRPTSNWADCSRKCEAVSHLLFLASEFINVSEVPVAYPGSETANSSVLFKGHDGSWCKESFQFYEELLQEETFEAWSWKRRGIQYV